MFMVIASHSSLTMYVRDAMDEYAHSSDPNDTFLAVENTYA